MLCSLWVDDVFTVDLHRVMLFGRFGSRLGITHLSDELQRQELVHLNAQLDMESLILISLFLCFPLIIFVRWRHYWRKGWTWTGKKSS